MTDATDLRTAVIRRIDPKTLEDLCNVRVEGTLDSTDAARKVTLASSDKLLAACEDAIDSFADYGIEYDGDVPKYVQVGVLLVQYHLALNAFNYEHANSLRAACDAEMERLTGTSRALPVTSSNIVVGDRADNDDFDFNPNVWDDIRIGDQPSVPSTTDDPRDN